MCCNSLDEQTIFLRLFGNRALYLTRSVCILTTRGTVGVHICVERRETGSSVTTVDQGVFGRANP